MTAISVVAMAFSPLAKALRPPHIMAREGLPCWQARKRKGGLIVNKTGKMPK